MYGGATGYGGGTEDVYGVEMSGQAAEPGKKFMHGQIVWCGCSTCLSVTALIFTLAAMGKYTEFVGAFSALPTEQADKMKFFVQGDLGTQMRNSAISSLISTILLGLCVVGIARKFMEDRNIKCCCILDGFCSCVYCLNGLSFCGATFFFFTIVGMTKYPTEVCAKVQQNLIAGVAGVTQTTTAAAPTVPGTIVSLTTTPALTEGGCIKAVELLKDLATLYGIFMMISTCVACTLASICSANAKAANELNEIFEDEEKGSGYGQPGGYY